MPNLTRDEAEDIVRKLQTSPADPAKGGFTIEALRGKNHDIYKVRYAGKWVGQFNIRRGSNRNLPHNFVADQLHMSRRQGLDFAECRMTVDDYIDLLARKSVID